jgi:hypothetical protein
VRHLPRAGLAACGLAIALLPFFKLDDHTPNGWDASWWIRLALLAALVGIVAERLRLAAAAVAVVAIAFRLAVPPDFGFAYDGLDVPTDRAWGAYVALATALAALLAEGLRLRARPAPPDPSPGSPRSGTGPEASSAGPAGPAPA